MDPHPLNYRYGHECSGGYECQRTTSSFYSNGLFPNVHSPLTLFKTEPNRGLFNLGNTCFMNSAIQCLSYTNPLTEYFLEQKYKRDINEDNPLGMGGKVAEAYHKLLIEMWSQHYCSYSPLPFKSVIESFAPQFCDHKQHDSQELLTFLLDGLHEDLNKVRKKADVDIEIESTERKDKAIAAEFWEKHVQRNQSVVVDLFQGQLKTTMTCGHCKKVSKIFDPTMFLSPPLPVKGTKNIKFTLVRAEPSAFMVEYNVEVHLEGTMADLLEKLSAMTGIKMEMMMAVSTYEGQFIHLYTGLEKITDLNIWNRTVYIYELSHHVTSSNWEHVPLYHTLDDSQSRSYDSSLPPPNIVCIRKKWSQERCRAAVMEKCQSLFIHYVCEDGETNQSHTNCQNLEEKIIYSKGDPHVLWKWSEDDKYIPKPTLQDHSSSRSANSPTLTDCLDLFTSEKKMGDNVPWYCSLCNNSGEATRKCDIWKLPQILIIHLTRFSLDRFGRQKLNTFVDFPINQLNLMDYVKDSQHPTVSYDLFAVCNHHGWLTGGHYTAYCKNSTTNQWYEYNDSQVFQISEKDVVTSDAYILFYQSDSSDHATAPTSLNPALEEFEQNVHSSKISSLAEEIQRIVTKGTAQEEIVQKLLEATATATATIEKRVKDAEQQIKITEERVIEVEKRAAERVTEAEKRAEERVIEAKKGAAERVIVAEKRVHNAEGVVNQAMQKERDVLENVHQLEFQLISMQGRANQAEKQLEGVREWMEQKYQNILIELRSKLAEFEKLQQERQAIQHYATVAEKRSKCWLMREQDLQITGEVTSIGNSAYMKVNAIKINLASQSQKEVFEQEMVFAIRLRHPNLVSYYGAIKQDRETIILSEPMLINLRDEIENTCQHPEYISRKHLLSIAIDISSALNYIHHLTPQPVIHRDLKSANVFLKFTSNESMLAKISTLSHFQGELQPQRDQESLVYAAPESSDPALISPKMDIFSFGVLLVEMFSAHFPFIEHRSALIESIDSTIQILIKSCLMDDPNMRPSAAQLIEYIQSIQL